MRYQFILFGAGLLLNGIFIQLVHLRAVTKTDGIVMMILNLFFHHLVLLRPNIQGRNGQTPNENSKLMKCFIVVLIRIHLVVVVFKRFLPGLPVMLIYKIPMSKMRVMEMKMMRMIITQRGRKLLEKDLRKEELHLQMQTKKQNEKIDIVRKRLKS